MKIRREETRTSARMSVCSHVYNEKPMQNSLDMLRRRKIDQNDR